jgi:hypothetical protein
VETAATCCDSQTIGGLDIMPVGAGADVCALAAIVGVRTMNRQLPLFQARGRREKRDVTCSRGANEGME